MVPGGPKGAMPPGSSALRSQLRSGASCGAKERAAGFAKEASYVFTELQKSELEGAKARALEKVGEHLEALAAGAKDDGHCGGGEVWRAKNWWDRREAFMKPGRSSALAEQRWGREGRAAAPKRAFERCGAEPSQLKRFKPGFSVEVGEDF